ncbi:MAG TPA: sigma 54-interacting transcriptional regulator [Polyangia bacterium]|nr:sigma 54-interacting transcriptional regulator [Polyangia bacterium]
MPARLVVTSGPDVGRSFVLDQHGGVVGRGEGSFIQLSDLSVSREHCRVQRRGSEFMVVDAGSRNKTYVNDKQVSEHVLTAGDEIRIGSTRLAFIPDEGGLAVIGGTSRMTIEISTRDVLAVAGDRAQALLGRLAQLGDVMRQADEPRRAATAACLWASEALSTRRAFLVSTGSSRTNVLAAHVDPGESTSLTVGKDVLTRAARGDAMALDGAAAAPVGEQDLLWVDGRERPFDQAEVHLLACAAHLVAAALDHVRARDLAERENRALRERLPGGTEFVGVSAGAEEVKTLIAKVGPTDTSVLLCGESGVGKEMVAQELHHASRRAPGPFVCVNCAALTETLLESELFGHEKGAFTGADARKPGRFELADGGSLFLDELGELSEKCQAKLLRVLEERRVTRVGGTKPIPVDVRLIAATNRNLSQMVERGQFREDLYYRISVIRIDVKPLRERPEDVPLLCEHFLERMARQAGRRIRGFVPEALAAMRAYSWPGNARELRNAIERAVVLGEGDLVQLSDLPPEISHAQAPSARTAAALASPALARPMREWERDAIVAALAATRGNKAQAAALLEIDRSTLYKKLKDYGIEA